MMAGIDGEIAVAMILALIFAWVVSLIVARRYLASVLNFMQTDSAPIDSHTVFQNESSQAMGVMPQATQIDLSLQNTKAIWRFKLTVIIISFLIAWLFSVCFLEILFGDELSLKKTLLLTLVYVWPVIPCYGFVQRWSRWNIFLLTTVHIAIVSCIVMLLANMPQTLIQVMIVFFSQMIMPLVFIVCLTSPKLRAIGPYLWFVFFILISSSLFGFHVLSEILAEGDADSWVVTLAMATQTNMVFIVFALLPWLLAYYPIRIIARLITSGYRKKYFSELLFLVAGVWLIALITQVLPLTHGMGGSAYWMLLFWFLIPLVFFLLKAFFRPHHSPPTLLLLRVFRNDDSIGKLFDEVLSRWRYSGNTLMIAANDLALRSLEPHELLDYLGGRIKNRFIRNNASLQKAVKALDLKADPDGRFRINEFFCFDRTWQLTLQDLVKRSNLVLMDLRCYTTERQGCNHELQVLSASQHLNKIIVLVDKDTDMLAAEKKLANASAQVFWVLAERHNQGLNDEVVEILLQSSNIN